MPDTTVVVPGATGSDSPDATGTPTVESLQAELARVKEALHSVNGESAGRRKRLEELEAAETQRQQAAMTESQKADALRKENEQLKADLAKTQLKASVTLYATKLNFVNVDDAFKLLELDGVDPTDTKAIEKALDALAKSGRLPLNTALPTTPTLPGLQTKKPGEKEMPSPGRRL